MAKVRKSKEGIPEYLYRFLTTGEKPDNSEMKNFRQKPGTWELYLLGRKNKKGFYGGNGNVPLLRDLWKIHKKEVLSRWQGPGKTFAEKLLESEKI